MRWEAERMRAQASRIPPRRPLTTLACNVPPPGRVRRRARQPIPATRRQAAQSRRWCCKFGSLFGPKVWEGWWVEPQVGHRAGPPVNASPALHELLVDEIAAQCREVRMPARDDAIHLRL